MLGVLLDTGFKSPTNVDTDNISSTNWLNPGNVTASDDARALEGNISGGDRLRPNTFGFAIPSNATIEGIEVRIERRRNASPSNIRDHVIRLWDGAEVGTNKASGAIWPTSDAVATYGGSGDDWGAGLTPADVNADSFGPAIRIIRTTAQLNTGGIDHVEVRVFYLEAAAPPTARFSLPSPPPAAIVNHIQAPGASALSVTGSNAAGLLATTFQPFTAQMSLATPEQALLLSHFEAPPVAALTATGKQPDPDNITIPVPTARLSLVSPLQSGGTWIEKAARNATADSATTAVVGVGVVGMAIVGVGSLQLDDVWVEQAEASF